nr:MAG: hypothetical protein CR961_00410 [Polaribacter sp.]
MKRIILIFVLYPLFVVGQIKKDTIFIKYDNSLLSKYFYEIINKDVYMFNNTIELGSENYYLGVNKICKRKDFSAKIKVQKMRDILNEIGAFTEKGMVNEAIFFYCEGLFDKILFIVDDENFIEVSMIYVID